MAIYDKNLDVYFLEEGDMLYLDGVTVEANTDGIDIDEDTVWLDEADIYWVDPHDGESYPVDCLMGWYASSKGVEKDDKRYGRMFIEKGQ